MKKKTKNMKRKQKTKNMVAVLMLASEIAWAADVSFSGQFRPRYNVVNDSQDATSADKFFDTRVRLNAKANVNANTEVFVQFQSVGQWGTNGADTGTRVQQGGPGTTFEASDTLADVGFHQAFVTLKNLYGQKVDAKIGRQEIVLDGHRLFGHTGWTQGAATQDAIRLTHAGGNHTLQYIYIENTNSGAKDAMRNGDDATHVVHASTQGVMGGALSGIFVIQDDNSAWAEAGTAAMDDRSVWYTIGARQKGKAGGLDYRVEFYHQFGDGTIAAGDLNAGMNANYTGLNDTCDCVDRDATMFGIRLGKTFKNASLSPTVTLWYDRLSGNDDEDVTSKEYGQFDTLYDTGHKFYGFMDQFLNRAGANSGYFGMQDIALKTKMSPKAGWTFKADLHHFRTAVDIAGNDGDAVATTKLGGKMDPDLGTELDLTLVHKYDSNTKIAVGYSHYWTSTTFSQANTGGGSNGATAGSNANDDADWAYVQIDTKF
jgi:hypothetical protein